MSSSLALDHLASGKVRELYDAGDGRLLLVASDRISAFDVVLPTPIPRQGPRAHGALAALVRAHRRHRAQPRDLGAARGLPGGRARSRAGGPDAARAPARDAAARVRRARLPRGLGLEGLRAHRRGLRHRAAGRAARGRPAAAPLFTPVDQGHERPRREHHGRAGHRARRRGRATARSRRASIALYERAAGIGARARHHPRRHEVRVRPRRRRLARRRRRGADARLVALLAAPTATRPARRRRPSTSSSCATGSRRSRGTRRRPAPSCPTRCATARPRATARPTSDSPAGRSRATATRWGCAREGDRAGPAQGGHPRPAGRGHPPGADDARLSRELGARRPRVRRRARRRRRRRGRARRPRGGRPRARERPDRGLRGRGRGDEVVAG